MNLLTVSESLPVFLTLSQRRVKGGKATIDHSVCSLFTSGSPSRISCVSFCPGGAFLNIAGNVRTEPLVVPLI